MRLTARRAVAEGLADHQDEQADIETLADIFRWVERVDDPCCRDCGWLELAKQELLDAIERRRRYLAQEGTYDPAFGVPYVI